MRSKWLWAALALVAVLGITTAASATTRGLITGKQIANYSINSKKLVNHTIQKHDLSAGLTRSLGTKAVERFTYGDLLKPSDWLPIVSGTWKGPNDPSVPLTRVMKMHLGPGNWLVTAEISASNYTGHGIIWCLLGNDRYAAVGQSAVGNAAGYAVQQTFELHSILPQATGQNLTLECMNVATSTPVGAPNIGYADIVATQIKTADLPY